MAATVHTTVMATGIVTATGTGTVVIGIETAIGIVIVTEAAIGTTVGIEWITLLHQEVVAAHAAPMETHTSQLMCVKAGVG